MSRLSPLAFATVLAAAMAPVGLAQETTPPVAGAPAGQEGVIAYDPAEFASARPNTALDMISRLPGFSLDGGDQVRGFAGAAGNVLIDGQRPTTKSDNIQDTLARIPIDQVQRIDLIRGGAPGIDMQGRSVIANVIRKRTDTFQQVVQANTHIFMETGHTIPGWNYQATRRAGDHQFDFTLGRGTSYDDSQGFGYRTRRDAATGAVTSFQTSETEADGSPHNIRLNYKGPLFGGTVSANSVLARDDFKDEQRLFNDEINERYMGRNTQDRGEIGLNYTRPLASNLEWETLALSKLNLGKGVATGVQNDATSVHSQLFTFDAESGESIARTILRYRQSPALQFEGGGEVAFNYLEQQVSFAQDGAFVALSASDVRVEELRGEVFAQGTWRPSPALSLEAGVRVEQSTITQSGDEAKERSFTYPKPRLLATWSLSGDDQFRARIERTVSQLDFDDFVSSVNLGTGVNTAGNSDLRPDKTTAYEAAYEHRFWGKGAFVLTLRHEEINDVVDRVPITVQVDTDGDGIPDTTNEISGPGNIGGGTNEVIDVSFTLPLDKLGVSGGEFKIQAMLQDSKVTDPFTGEERRISGQRADRINVDYRQDLPDLKLTYGFGWYAGWAQEDFLRTEVQALDLRSFFTSFIEYKPTPRLTLTAQINNWIPYQFDIERRIHSGRRGTAPLDSIELEHRDSQVIVQLRARWAIG